MGNGKGLVVGIEENFRLCLWFKALWKMKKPCYRLEDILDNRCEIYVYGTRMCDKLFYSVNTVSPGRDPFLAIGETGYFSLKYSIYGTLPAYLHVVHYVHNMQTLF
jgi:hypothetical protein